MRRNCRFLRFIQTFKIIQNEQFINASILTYSGKLLSQIFEVAECFSWRKSLYCGGINDHLMDIEYIEIFPECSFLTIIVCQFYIFLKRAFKGKIKMIFIKNLSEDIPTVLPSTHTHSYPLTQIILYPPHAGPMWLTFGLHIQLHFDVCISLTNYVALRSPQGLGK